MILIPDTGAEVLNDGVEGAVFRFRSDFIHCMHHSGVIFAAECFANIREGEA